MKALFFLVWISVTATAFSQSNFEVDLVIPAKKYLYVNGNWEKGTDCIEAKVSVSANTAAKDVVAKAYFFSADGKLIHTENKPESEGRTNGTTVNPMPEQFERGKKHSVLFLVPKDISMGANKWKRVVVVFGGGDDFAYKIYPKDDLAKFKFPEKLKKPSE